MNVLYFVGRMLEDHDCLVENVMMWTRDSNNRLLFAERADKYDVFYHPEVRFFFCLSLPHSPSSFVNSYSHVFSLAR